MREWVADEIVIR